MDQRPVLVSPDLGAGRRAAWRGAWGAALSVLVLAAVGAMPAASQPLPDYAAWSAACRRVPGNRELGIRPIPRDLLPLRSYGEFGAVLEPFLEMCRTGALARAGAWLGSAPRAETFFNLDAAYYLQREVPFEPFAQREELPPGARVFLHGDLHGDLHSLIAFLDELQRGGDLEGFRIARPEVRLAFLGDFTDRGRFGVEVLYTLMRLKLENPERVFLVRGNHEDVSLIARYGFLAEVGAKYGQAFDVARVARLFDFLPAVLYLDCAGDVVQCNHGGLEPGYDPVGLLGAPPSVSFQLLGRLNQRRLLVAKPGWLSSLPAGTRRALDQSLVDFVPTSPTTPSVLGFMWNDFTVFPGEDAFAIDPGRAFVYGDAVVRVWLEQVSTPERRVRAIFRAHQHAAVLNPMMRRLIASRGAFRHWQAEDRPALQDAAPEDLRRIIESDPERSIPDGSVWTFSVSPDSIYGAGCGYSFGTAGELVTAARWEDWRLRVRNVEVPDRRPVR